MFVFIIRVSDAFSLFFTKRTCNNMECFLTALAVNKGGGGRPSLFRVTNGSLMAWGRGSNSSRPKAAKNTGCFKTLPPHPGPKWLNPG